MKKTLLTIVSGGLFLLGIVSSGQAILIDNHDGTITQIREDGSILMWMQDAGHIEGQTLQWMDAMTWAENFTFAGYDDWRLPSALNSDGTGPCAGYDCSDSEMGYMYYTELGNSAHDSYTYDGPFLNNWHAGYWTSTSTELIVLEMERAFIFNYHVGNQAPDFKTLINWAWLVRDVAPAPEPIAVDIKPRSCPNLINTRSKGGLPVAILGTDDFDVTQVDPATVKIEGAAPLRWSIKDVAAPYAGDMEVCDIYACNELPWDGYEDLSLKFDTQEVVAALGAVSDGDCLILELTGNLKEEFGGTPIGGKDVVIILKKK